MKASKVLTLFAVLVGMTVVSCRQEPKKPAPFEHLIPDSIREEITGKPAPPSPTHKEVYSKTYEGAYERGYEEGYNEMPDYPDERKMTDEQRQAFEDGYEEGLDDSYDGFE